jgi:hypothetical protein
MPERAMGIVLGATGTVLVAVVGGAAALDHAVFRGRRQWWARWLP